MFKVFALFPWVEYRTCCFIDNIDDFAEGDYDNDDDNDDNNDDGDVDDAVAAAADDDGKSLDDDDDDNDLSSRYIINIDVRSGVVAVTQVDMAVRRSCLHSSIHWLHFFSSEPRRQQLVCAPGTGLQMTTDYSIYW